ncbi:MAG: hypothetical protein WCF95_00985 [bacterium]
MNMNLLPVQISRDSERFFGKGIITSETFKNPDGTLKTVIKCLDKDTLTLLTQKTKIQDTSGKLKKVILEDTIPNIGKYSEMRDYVNGKLVLIKSITNFLSGDKNANIKQVIRDDSGRVKDVHIMSAKSDSRPQFLGLSYEYNHPQVSSPNRVIIQGNYASGERVNKKVKIEKPISQVRLPFERY